MMYLKSSIIHWAKSILIKRPKAFLYFLQLFPAFIKFRKETGNRFQIRKRDLYPCLTDSVATTPFDQHYIYHPAWAIRKVLEINPQVHTDISSILHFGTLLSAVIPVDFYDYRPAAIALPGYTAAAADLLRLPFSTDSISSLSCLHTLEHIGLGRYGDPIDGNGDLKAAQELMRVLKPGGDLLIALPVGKPKIEFNAHRIYSYEQVLSAFSSLTVHEFSLIPDAGGLLLHANPALVAAQHYACGCFWFKKPG